MSNNVEPSIAKSFAYVAKLRLVVEHFAMNCEPKTQAALADAELVSITAGANDLGFAQIIGICATLSPMDCRNAVTAATSEASLGALTLALADTYKAIQAAAPAMRGQLSYTDVKLGFPEEMDGTPLLSGLGPLPHTSLADGIAATMTIFRQALADGRLAPRLP